MLCLVAQSCPTLCDPMDCSLLGSSVHGDSPGKNTGVGCHALLQGIFPTQGSNPGLSHCRWFLYRLSHQGSLVYVESVHKLWGFSKSSVVKNLPANTGDAGSIPGWGRSPGEGSGNPLQYSCLEHPRDRGSWGLQSRGSPRV